jgi:ribosomal protein S6E (S10)
MHDLSTKPVLIEGLDGHETHMVRNDHGSSEVLRPDLSRASTWNGETEACRRKRIRGNLVIHRICRLAIALS